MSPVNNCILRNSTAAVQDIRTGPSEAESLNQPLYMHISHYKQPCCNHIFSRLVQCTLLQHRELQQQQQSRTNRAQKRTYHGYENRINAWMKQTCRCAPFNSSAQAGCCSAAALSASLPPSLSLCLSSPIADPSHCRGTTGVCGSRSPLMTQHTTLEKESITAMISHWSVHCSSPLECHL